MHAIGGCMKKYLMYLSYAGSEFRGIQKQLPNYQNGKLIIVNTVQQVIEDSLTSVFKPLHDVKVYISSRTDAGVHALRTTVHFYLHMPRDAHPDYITGGLNKHFLEEKIGMRIQSTHIVPQWFHCRTHATSRTYVYRIALRKRPRPERTITHLNELPFSEDRRTFFIQRADINVDRMQEAAALLRGTKDFFSFMGKPTKQPSSQSTIRSIYSLSITPGRPFMPQYDPNAQLYDYWDITCHGRAFLYRMVRRIVGVLLAVGGGEINLDDVHRLLDKPVPESWDPRVLCVPPWGLYLVDVTYNPLNLLDPVEAFEFGSENEDTRTTLALTH